MKKAIDEYIEYYNNKRYHESLNNCTRSSGPASTLNECWSIDFVSDQRFDGTQFSTVTVVDNFSRRSLAIKARKSLKGKNVV